MNKHDYEDTSFDGESVVPQETFSNNMIYIRQVNDNIHDYSVEVRSISRDESKPKRTLAIRRVAKRRHHTSISVFLFQMYVKQYHYSLYSSIRFTNDKQIIETIIGK